MFSVLSFNTCTESQDLAKRLELAARNLQDTQCDLVVLQEVSLPIAEQVLLAPFADTYHRISAGHHTPALDAGFLYLPSATLAVASALVLLFSSWTWLSVVLVGVAAFLWPSVFYTAFRWVFRNVLSPQPPPSFASLPNDWMGQTVLAKKTRWNAAVLHTACAFPHHLRGYQRPTSVFAVGAWLLWWIKMTVLRPGFVIVRLLDSRGRTDCTHCADDVAMGTCVVCRFSKFNLSICGRNSMGVTQV
jgi:hypothetical protein